MSRLKRALNILLADPALFARVLPAKLRGLFPAPKGPVRRPVCGVLFEFDFTLGPSVKSMYCGFFEYETCAAMRRLLRPRDTFLDVGASIGYLTAVGAGLVGPSGQVHSFEPMPEHFQRLRALAAANPEFRIVTSNCALGETEGEATIYVPKAADIGWNTMVPGFMPAESRARALTVPVHRLDAYVREQGLNSISLVKIDVEGFEFPVLKGFSEYLRYADRRPAIICEVAPAAYPLLGCTPADLARHMAGFGYVARSVLNPRRAVDLAALTETTNVLFLPAEAKR